MGIEAHQAHCCVRHGCKYGERRCAVTSGVVPQLHPCEQCSDQMVDQRIQRARTWASLFDPTDGSYPPDLDDASQKEGYWVDLLDDRGALMGGGAARDVRGLVEYNGVMQVAGIIASASVFHDGVLIWQGQTSNKTQVSVGQHILMSFDVLQPF
jgi:hypothetical protein